MSSASYDAAAEDGIGGRGADAIGRGDLDAELPYPAGILPGGGIGAPEYDRGGAIEASAGPNDDIRAGLGRNAIAFGGAPFQPAGVSTGWTTCWSLPPGFAI